jgi:hypothetical protein
MKPKKKDLSAAKSKQTLEEFLKRKLSPSEGNCPLTHLHYPSFYSAIRYLKQNLARRSYIMSRIPLKIFVKGYGYWKII